MGTYTVPVATAAEVETGWAGIEKAERAARAQVREEIRTRTLRAELVAAGIEPPALDAIVAEDIREQQYRRLMALIAAADPVSDDHAALYGMEPPC